MDFRKFPSHIEQIAHRASKERFFSDTLTPQGNPTGTADGALPVVVGAGKSLAFAKPTNFQSHSEIHAVHEKIAADLAFNLGLPVPPVQLVKGGALPNYSHLMAISYVPFPQPRPLSDHNLLSNQDITRLSVTANAMQAFYTWILDGDHAGHQENVIFGRPDQTSEYDLAFIDHSYSLTHSWDRQNPAAAASVGHIHHIFSGAGNSGALEVANRILGLEESAIRGIIEPLAAYLPPGDADALATYLLARRTGLAALF
ncbi:MAG: hypothetical protein ACOZAM_15760 [Pseudomonadota bacterium]